MDKTHSSPEISVVIPAYNEEKLIGKCLEALAQQSFPPDNYEVIVVNNASTDHTAEIVHSFAPNFPHLTLIHEPDHDISVARNSGFKKARAIIIASTDADTQVPSDWLEQIWTEFERNEMLAGLTGTYRYSGKSRLFNTLSTAIMKVADNTHRLLTGSFPFRGANFAVKKKLWAMAGGFTPHFGVLEDIDLSLRVGRLGKINYLADLVVSTTYRRFQGRFFKQLAVWTKAYLGRVIFKSNKKVYWEPVR
ncbi:glycosyltransferase [Patescibacteria group bacterium]|nr:glycosyltransferase [Patescibacteria group bacterium]